MAIKAGKHTIKLHPEKCTGCSSCQLICSLIFLGEFNPLEAYVRVEREGDSFWVSFTDECQECNLCADFCMHGAMELVEVTEVTKEEG